MILLGLAATAQNQVCLKGRGMFRAGQISRNARYLGATYRRGVRGTFRSGRGGDSGGAISCWGSEASGGLQTPRNRTQPRQRAIGGLSRSTRRDTRIALQPLDDSDQAGHVISRTGDSTSPTDCCLQLSNNGRQTLNIALSGTVLEVESGVL